MNVDDLDNRFEYHPPLTEDRRLAHETVRHMCRELAHHVDEVVPDGREKALAVTKIEEVMFWANAGLARQLDVPMRE